MITNICSSGNHCYRIVGSGGQFLSDCRLLGLYLHVDLSRPKQRPKVQWQRIIGSLRHFLTFWQPITFVC